MKRLMDTAGHGHVMSTDQKTREMSLTHAGGWEAPEGYDGGRGKFIIWDGMPNLAWEKSARKMDAILWNEREE